MINSEENKKEETNEGVTPSVPGEKLSMSDAILKEMDEIDAVVQSRKDLFEKTLKNEGENKGENKDIVEKSAPTSATGTQNIEDEPEFRKLTVTLSNDDYDLLLEEYIQLGIPNDEAFLLTLINERGSTRTYQNAIKKNNPTPQVEEIENKDTEVKKEPIANKAPDETQSSKHAKGKDSYVPPPTKMEDTNIDLSTVNWWKWGAIGIGSLVIIYMLWNYFKNKTPNDAAQLAQGTQKTTNSAVKASAPVVNSASSTSVANSTKGMFDTEGLNV